MKLSKEDWIKQNYPEIEKLRKKAEEEYYSFCYFPDCEEKATDKNPWNSVCKKHYLMQLRADARYDAVYKYINYGVDEANKMAVRDFPDTWKPEWWKE